VADVAHHPALAHQFDSLGQQTEAATLGMWVFLVTEVLFFGGLFRDLRGVSLVLPLRRSAPRATSSTSCSAASIPPS
jgi:heme/copper-type cytochrome/quinol oxidase subunit 3